MTWNGTLGDVVYSGNVEVNLATEGTYDPATYGWAVVFDCTSIHVESGAVVTFLNHPSRAPVIWHATGNILIEGEVDLNGQDGHHHAWEHYYSEPGPGGFRGGKGSYYDVLGSSAGFGPGGGFLPADGSGHGGPASYGTSGVPATGGGLAGDEYGSAGLFPLIGGSGGSAGANFAKRTGGGGAGGGVILIAAQGQLELSTSAGIYCNGGLGGNADDGHGIAGSGSGGAIRLVGDSVSILGSATLEARGGITLSTFYGGAGRIRIEAATSLIREGLISPEPEVSEQEIFEIIPLNEPTLQIVSIDPDGFSNGYDWIDVTGDTDEPEARLDLCSLADIQDLEAGKIGLEIRANHVHFDEIVEVRVTHARGQAVYYDSTPLQLSAGTVSTATVEIDLVGGISAVQLRVDYTD